MPYNTLYTEALHGVLNRVDDILVFFVALSCGVITSSETNLEHNFHRHVDIHKYTHTHRGILTQWCD